MNYNKRHWKYLNHIERYKKYIRTNGLPCQECGGSGSYVEDSIDFGDDWCGPIREYIYAPCGWCEGTGKVTRWVRGFWLRCKKEEKINSRK